MAYMISVIVSLYIATTVGSIEICPGEGPRYGDFKCNHDRTHRVCARLVDNSNGQCKELAWNDNQQSFWQITGQQRWNWKRYICNPPNPGDSWCICMWATASLIRKVGCDNVHINCAATDVPYLMGSARDGGWDLTKARECVEKKCPDYMNGTTSEIGSNESAMRKCRCRWIKKEGMLMEDEMPNLPVMDIEKAKIKCELSNECKAITCRSETMCWLNAKSTGNSDAQFTAHVKYC